MGHRLFKRRAGQDAQASEFAATVVSVPYVEPGPAANSALLPDIDLNPNNEAGTAAKPMLSSIGRYALKQQLGQGDPEPLAA